MDHSGNYNWNDNVSSLATNANCQVLLYRDASWSSEHTGYLTTTYYVGDRWNDRTTYMQVN